MLIFNFHHIEDDILHPSRKHITMTSKGLSRFIRTLRLLGFEIVSLRDVIENPEQLNHPKSKKQVALTFDDGYVNNYRYAVPVLEAEQCPATIFVLPGRFQGTNEWDQGDLPAAQRDQLMTLEQMQELAKSPFVTFGSHGMTHRDFSTLDFSTLQYELEESHLLLSQALGDSYLPVLAYPWGNYSQFVLDAMPQSPYQYAFTVETKAWTSQDSRFEVPRYSAFYRDGNPLVLLAKLCRHGLLI